MTTITTVEQLPVQSVPWYHITLRDYEKIGRAISAVTLDPFKNSFYYVFPWFKLAQSGSWTRIYPEDSLYGKEQIDDETITSDQRKKLFEEIEAFKVLAGTKRNILPHLSNGNAFLSVGGTCSLSSPGIVIPKPKITKGEISQETQFRIAREIGHIKKNDALIRLIMKIIVITAIFVALTVATHGVGGLLGLAMLTAIPTGTLGCIGYGLFFAITIPLHIFLEKYYQGQMDKEGVKFLAKRMMQQNSKLTADEAIQNAKTVARQTLEKEIEWNKAHPCFYIKKNGDNRFDFSYPSLTKRIIALSDKP